MKTTGRGGRSQDHVVFRLSQYEWGRDTNIGNGAQVVKKGKIQ